MPTNLVPRKLKPHVQQSIHLLQILKQVAKNLRIRSHCVVCQQAESSQLASP